MFKISRIDSRWWYSIDQWQISVVCKYSLTYFHSSSYLEDNRSCGNQNNRQAIQSYVTENNCHYTSRKLFCNGFNKPSFTILCNSIDLREIQIFRIVLKNWQNLWQYWNLFHGSITGWTSFLECWNFISVISSLKCQPSYWPLWCTVSTNDQIEVKNFLANAARILTLNVTCISESCIEIKIKVNFYFHTSSWCLKRFYEGL